MVRDYFSSLKDCIVELGPLMPPRSESREKDEEEVDLAQKEPPMEPDSSVVSSRAHSPVSVQPSPSSGVAPSSSRAPTIEELARQSILDREPPSCPFVTTTSGVAFMPMPLAARFGGTDPIISPYQGPQ
ncbi:unnamed protein product [Calypogeia fissa]